MIQNLLTDINAAVRQYIADLPHVSPEKAGLDRRAGYGLWIGEDCIIAEKRSDSALQYYGGFQYAEDRVDTGEFVIYRGERADDCINAYLGRGE